jgi:hypothetical protein
MPLISYLRLSCDKATALMERRDLVPLSIGERTGLWWHRRICSACRAYEAQSQAIDQLLEKRNAALLDTSELEARILSGFER